MPSSLSHAMVAVAGGSMIAPRPLLRTFLITGAVCAVIPDIDAIGRLWTGGGDLEWLGGHRGFTHSLTFAALLGLFLPLATLGRRPWDGYRTRFGVFIAFATVSHGLLDTITSIGAAHDGVQFLSPFSSRQFTLSRHLIHGPFSELFYLLLPLMAITRIVWHRRGMPWPRRRRERPQSLLS
ncbi:MAG TPA: metal-dependent hydrolase [Vicinamibacterales bacterium]